MSFGKNLQYLRRLNRNMTQEELAEKMNVSRQSVSKWELDTAVPNMDKGIELCRLFNVTLDRLFREDMGACMEQFSSLRVETVPAMRTVQYTVISADPEGDALGHLRAFAKDNGVTGPRLIGWDFPCLSPEQTNVYRLHGYTAAWILPDGVTPGDAPVCEQKPHRYAAIHIDRPFESPFTTIPAAYTTLMDYMRVNGLKHTEKDVIPCFETDGEAMDVYIACE